MDERGLLSLQVSVQQVFAVKDLLAARDRAREFRWLMAKLMSPEEGIPSALSFANMGE